MLVTYISDSYEISDLVQAAIMHAQFEMIHPFKDGNGRVGRLLIPLLLFHKKVIPHPIFYISRFFAENNDLYKEKLSNISTAKNKLNAWKDWLMFFFDGVSLESMRHIETSKKIIALHKEMTSAIKKTDMISLIDMLFQNLRIQPTEAIAELKLPGSSVRKELSVLADKGFITKTGSPRKTIYIFTKILEIMNI